MSQETLGKAVGCAGSTIATYERGGMVPRDGRVRKLAKALGVPEEALYETTVEQRDALRDRLITLIDDMDEADRAEALSQMLRMQKKRRLADVKDDD